MSSASAPRRIPRAIALALAACLAGCGAQPAPAPPAGAASTPSAAAALPSAAPPASTAPASARAPHSDPPGGASASPPGLGIDLHALPASESRAVGPVVANDGHELVWAVAAGPGGPMPDLASFTPGRDAGPAVFYRSPKRDSTIWDIAVRDGGCAFLEENPRQLGDGGWRLWALPPGASKAVLLDSSVRPPADGRPAAMFAMTRDGVVWTAVHDRDGHPGFELRAARLDGSGARVMQSAPMKARQIWYPSSDPAGTTVVYGTVEPAGSGYAYRVWSLRLDDPKAVPVRLGDSDAATQPVTNGASLVWRTVDGNAGNWSTALVAASPDGSGGVSVQVHRLLGLSLGRRFAAFDTEAAQSVTLYDTAQGRLVDVERYEAPDTRGIQPGWTVVAGDLLVFRRVDYYNQDEAAAAPPAIVWAVLPGS